MGVEPYNFVSALNCILAQRLVRVICTHCKHSAYATDEYLRAERAFTRCSGARCRFLRRAAAASNAAGTGFRGRTSIHELLDLSERIREMILDRRPADPRSSARRAKRA
jgi:type IV pilus assembly protein PilB